MFSIVVRYICQRLYKMIHNSFMRDYRSAIADGKAETDCEKMVIELTGLCSVRGYGGGGRQSGDAAKRLSTTVLDTPAVTWRGGRCQPFVVPDGGPDHRDLVELVPAVVMAQSRRAGAGPATPDAAIVPGTGVGATAAGAPAPGPAPKRLHQSLGARRHSTEVIQPSGIRFLLS